MSEFSLIANYFSRHTTSKDGVDFGVGDDCALITPLPCEQLVACVDTLVAGRHFPVDTEAYAIGHKAVAVNLSDLAAMGATPHSILLALSLPKADEAWLADFSEGLYAICERFGVQLIGGDTTKSSVLSISITALGFVPKGEAVRRDGAKVGDVICVSGELGSAAFALQSVLQGEDNALRSALDYPNPRVALGQQLRGFAHAMIDVSDGLVQDLGHILQASGVAGELYLEQIPLNEALQAVDFDTAMRHALSGGDDYELCFTLPSEALAKFRQVYPDVMIYPIGKIVAATTPHKHNKSHENSALICYHNGEIYPFTATGFNHFD